MQKFYSSIFFLAFAQLIFAQNNFYMEDFGATTAANWTAIEVQGDGSTSSNWTHTNIGPMGAYANESLASTTAENGWYIFDSDLNCSYENQEAWLVSPALDASGEDKVFLTFETYYRSFNDRPTVEVSRDSMTWVSYEVFPNIEATFFGGNGENPQQVYVDISDVAAGEGQFWIAFRFLSDASTANGGNLTGCAYAWQIDDVALTSIDPRPANDMHISPDFFAIAPNIQTPFGQLTPFSFLADIENKGSTVQESASLNVSITELENNTEVFSDNLSYGEIGLDSLVQSQVFPNTFTPAVEAAAYTATYTLALVDEDERPMDNIQSFDFMVSDSTFAKATQGTRLLAPSEDNSYAYGNCYYIPNGAGQYARFMSFMVGNAEELINSSVSILMYKWEGDLNGDFSANADEYGAAAVAFNSYTFDGSESNILLTLPVSEEGEGVLLEDDSYYFIVVQFNTADEDKNMFLLGSDELDYNAAWFASTIGDGPIQYASMLDVGNTGDFSVVGFGWDVVPIMQLHIGENADLNVAARETLSLANKITLHPNPATAIARLDIDLVNAQAVEVEIFNTMGQRVFVQKMGKIKQGELDLDVSKFIAGTYFVLLRAEEGIRIIKLSVMN